MVLAANVVNHGFSFVSFWYLDCPVGMEVVHIGLELLELLVNQRLLKYLADARLFKHR